MSLVVDIHPHIISTDTTRYPITPLLGKRSDWSHDRSVTMEEMISAMDAGGVDMAAMVHSSTTYGFNCDYVADAVAKYPKRITGVFSVNVLEPGAAAEMRAWYAKGMTGMRIFSRGTTIKEPWLALDDPRVFPCYECAAELGISVASNMRFETFSEMENILKRFPKVNFILDDLGKVDFSDGAPFNAATPLWRLAQYPNFYLKILPRNFIEASKGKSTPESQFAKLVSEFGANRLAWGSNFPAAEESFADLLTLVKTTISSLSQQDQDWIMGKTALTLYPALAAIAKESAGTT